MYKCSLWLILCLFIFGFEYILKFHHLFILSSVIYRVNEIISFTPDSIDTIVFLTPWENECQSIYEESATPLLFLNILFSSILWGYRLIFTQTIPPFVIILYQMIPFIKKTVCNVFLIRHRVIVYCFSSLLYKNIYTYRAYHQHSS